MDGELATQSLGAEKDFDDLTQSFDSSSAQKTTEVQKDDNYDKDQENVIAISSDDLDDDDEEDLQG